MPLQVHSAGKLNVADDQGLDLQYPIWKPQMEVVQPASYAERMDGLICTAMRAAVEEYALSICKIAQDAGMSMRDVYEIANRQRTVSTSMHVRLARIDGRCMSSYLTKFACHDIIVLLAAHAQTAVVTSLAVCICARTFSLHAYYAQSHSSS